MCKICTYEKSIVLFDNYVDDTVLMMFDKRKANVTATIYTKSITKQFPLDLEKHNAKYQPIEIDDSIGPFYGLTTEDIDFIKNYVLEFRMAGE